MIRTHAPVAPALAALAAAAALAGCTTQPQYAIAPNGSAGPSGRAEPVRPEYAIAPGGSAGAQGRAEAPTPALPPPAATSPSAAPGEEAPGPRVGAEPVDSAPLEAPPPAPPPPPPPPAPTSAAPSASASRASAAAAASERLEAEARRRRLVEAKAKALLPARREPATNRYTLAKGDTLYGVGRRFGVAPAELAHANGLKLAATLRPGTTVLLPEDVRAGRAAAGAKGEFVTTPGKPVAPTRAERAAALARAEALVPPVRDASPPPVRTATAAAPLYRPYAPPPPAARSFAAAPATAVRPPSAPVSADVEVPVAVPRAAPRTEPTLQAQAAPPTPDAPRPYASLGPLDGRRAARGASLPSSRSGGRTAQDAQAAYAVAAARAAQHGDIAGARTASAVASSGIESGRGRFSWPVKGEVLSGFGPKGPGQRNDGVDIAAVDGEAVRAAAAGEVVYAGHDVPALGNLVAVKHTDGWVTIYANLQRITVHPRDRVGQGGQVGLAGASGAAARPQVHFEVRYAPSATDKARPVDPQLVLPGASAAAVRAAG